MFRKHIQLKAEARALEFWLHSFNIILALLLILPLVYLGDGYNKDFYLKVMITLFIMRFFFIITMSYGRKTRRFYLYWPYFIWTTFLAVLFLVISMYTEHYNFINCMILLYISIILLVVVWHGILSVWRLRCELINLDKSVKVYSFSISDIVIDGHKRTQY